jgi:hypothetical protein
MDQNEIERVIASTMWDIVVQHTGNVGYRGATKREGLAYDPPVIDCSGWAAMLLTSAMEAINSASRSEVFNSEYRASIATWSDRMIALVEARVGAILNGEEISLANLPPYALIGLRQGGGAWANNHPRKRGITHVAQIVRRPTDRAPFISESQGWARPHGLRLTELSEWLDLTRPWLKAGEAWAVDPFAPPVDTRC